MLIRYLRILWRVWICISGVDEPVRRFFPTGFWEALTGATIVDVRRKAIQVALCIACGAFQTGLLSYFTHRDLFPALMKVCGVINSTLWNGTRAAYGGDSL